MNIWKKMSLSIIITQEKHNFYSYAVNAEREKKSTKHKGSKLWIASPIGMKKKYLF